MTNAHTHSLSMVENPPFGGAQRAERYFEEAPTETVRHAAAAPAAPVVTQVPTHLTVVPQVSDNPSGEPASEALLRRVVEPIGPAPLAAPPAAAPTTRTSRSPWARRREQLAELERARSTVRLSTWPRSVGILVANPKGSVGKTPTSLLLGGVIASIRGGQTVVVEVTDDPGSLALRAEGPSWAGLGELVRDVNIIRGAGELSNYSAQQTSFAAVVASPRDRDPLGHADVQSITGLLQYFYPVRVMDSGNQVTSSAFHGAVQAADVLVIPVVDAPDAVAGAEQLLRHLRRTGAHGTDLAATAVAVRLDDGRRRPVTERTTEALHAAGVTAIVDIPFDPHIDERSTLSLDRLRPSTLHALTRTAAIVSDRLTARLR